MKREARKRKSLGRRERDCRKTKARVSLCHCPRCSKRGIKKKLGGGKSKFGRETKRVRTRVNLAYRLAVRPGSYGIGGSPADSEGEEEGR